jgi:hypothetical protein
MKKQLLTLLFFLAGYSATFAQTAPKPCATPAVKSEWLKRYQQNPAAFPKSNERMYVDMTIHIMGNDDGQGYYSIAKTLNAFCELNEDFEQADIQFILKDILYHDATAFYSHQEFEPGYEMMYTYNVPNTLNCYIVEDPAGACGYSIYGVGIALKQTCINAGDNTWAHEAGHALSLPHPFYGWEGYDHNYNLPAPSFVYDNEVERIDGTNCQNAGDGFCDTAPDYLNYRWGCNNNSYSTTSQKDPNGVSFYSDGSLFMSYALDGCSYRFSDDQIAAMRANLLDDNEDLMSETQPGEPITADIVLAAITPAQGGSAPDPTAVTLQWEPIPNATHYVVQLNPFSFFSVVVNQFIVEGTSLTVDNLLANRTYHWRVRPFNNIYTCAPFSNAQQFTTGSVTGASDLSVEQLLSVYPNPIGKGQNLQLRASEMMQGPALITLSTVTGSKIWSSTPTLVKGDQEIEIDTEKLSAGAYVLRVIQDGNQWQTKLIIQK